jgi:hypothetical protein
MAVVKIKFSPVDIEARKKLDFHAGDTIKVWSVLCLKQSLQVRFSSQILKSGHKLLTNVIYKC